MRPTQQQLDRRNEQAANGQAPYALLPTDIAHGVQSDRILSHHRLQVDELHEKYLSAVQKLFDTHRAALGWSHKELRFV